MLVALQTMPIKLFHFSTHICFIAWENVIEICTKRIRQINSSEKRLLIGIIYIYDTYIPEFNHAIIIWYDICIEQRGY